MDTKIVVGIICPFYCSHLLGPPLFPVYVHNPPLSEPCPGDEVLDARQVKAVAEALQELDRSGKLEQHLRAPREMPACVISEEGLILGMQDPEGFRAAAQATPCR